MQKPSSNSAFSYADALLLVVVFLWGGHFGVVKSALPFIHPMAFASLRFMLASATLFLILWLTEGSVAVRMRRDFLWCLALGVFSGMDQVLWMYGLNMTTSAKSALLLATSPLFVTILAFLHGERPSGRALAGIIIAFFGVTIIVWPYGSGFATAFAGGQLAGDLLTLAAAVFWGAYTAYGGRVLDRYSALRVTTWAFFWTAVVVTIPGAGILVRTPLSQLPIQAWGAFGYSVFLAGIIGFVLWYNGIQHIGPIRVAIYQYMVPVVAMFLSFFLWREPFNVFQVIGAIVVLGGIVAVRLDTWATRRKDRAQARALQRACND